MALRVSSAWLLCVVLLVGGVASAQGYTATQASSTSGSNLDVRMSIVENRLGRLESDVARLANTPTQLARIEEKVTVISERATSNSGIFQAIGMGVFMMVLSGAFSYQFGKRSGGKS